MRDLSLSFSSSTYLRKPKLGTGGIPMLNLILIGSIVFFGFIYLFGISSLSTKGYEIRQLEQKITKMETENKHLQMEVSSLQSINRIQQEAQKLNFVPSTNVTYIKDADFALK